MTKEERDENDLRLTEVRLHELQTRFQSERESVDNLLADAHFRRKVLSSSWQQWRTSILEQREQQRLQLCAATLTYAHRLSFLFFRAWKYEFNTRLRRRSQFLTAIQHHPLALQRMCFRGWKRYKLKKEECTRGLLAIRTDNEVSLLKRSVSKWLDLVDNHKKCRELLWTSTRQELRSALIRWQTAVNHISLNRRSSAMLHHLENRIYLRQHVFVLWLLFSRSKKLARDVATELALRKKHEQLTQLALSIHKKNLNRYETLTRINAFHRLLNHRRVQLLYRLQIRTFRRQVFGEWSNFAKSQLLWKAKYKVASENYAKFLFQNLQRIGQRRKAEKLAASFYENLVQPATQRALGLLSLDRWMKYRLQRKMRAEAVKKGKAVRTTVFRRVALHALTNYCGGGQDRHSSSTRYETEGSPLAVDISALTPPQTSIRRASEEGSLHHSPSSTTNGDDSLSLLTREGRPHLQHTGEEEATSLTLLTAPSPLDRLMTLHQPVRPGESSALTSSARFQEDTYPASSPPGLSSRGTAPPASISASPSPNNILYEDYYPSIAVSSAAPVGATVSSPPSSSAQPSTQRESASPAPGLGNRPRSRLAVHFAEEEEQDREEEIRASSEGQLLAVYIRSLVAEFKLLKSAQAECKVSAADLIGSEGEEESEEYLNSSSCSSASADGCKGVRFSETVSTKLRQYRARDKRLRQVENILRQYRETLGHDMTQDDRKKKRRTGKGNWEARLMKPTYKRHSEDEDDIAGDDLTSTVF